MTPLHISLSSWPLSKYLNPHHHCVAILPRPQCEYDLTLPSFSRASSTARHPAAIVPAYFPLPLSSDFGTWAQTRQVSPSHRLPQQTNHCSLSFFPMVMLPRLFKWLSYLETEDIMSCFARNLNNTRVDFISKGYTLQTRRLSESSTARRHFWQAARHRTAPAWPRMLIGAKCFWWMHFFKKLFTDEHFTLTACPWRHNKTFKKQKRELVNNTAECGIRYLFTRWNKKIKNKNKHLIVDYTA